MITHPVSKLFFGCILSGGLMIGCSPTQPKGSDNARQSPLQWQKYEQEAAQVFIDQCKDDLELASTTFEVLAKSRSSIPDLALLNQLNHLDIVSDRIAGRAELYEYAHPEPAMREAGSHCREHLVDLIADISLSRPIYNRLVKVDAQALNKVDRRYWEKLVESFELSGVSQSKKKRERIRALSGEILNIGQEFDRVIREDVRQVRVTPAQLAGLPKDFIDTRPVDDQGLISITTYAHDYIPVMRYAHSDSVRERLYKEFRSRGYPKNKAVLASLLEKRHELANLLGFQSYAEYILSNKMIGTPQNAADFIDNINAVAKPRAADEYSILLQRLKQLKPSATKVEDWQKAYIENLISTEVYELDAQEVRQYFSYNKVKNGIFELVQDIFSVTIEPWKTEVWHPSVEAFELWDDDKLIGQFYLDMHPREGKYKNAAHFGIREGVAGIQTPISALVGNFPSDASGLRLMEHSQVETFLHEFGHLLHSMFGGHQPWLTLSGVNTERDFVEAPSQMLEEWVWDAQILKTFATNAQDEAIPPSTVERMNNRRDFGRGLFTRHQMFYAALSLNYYNKPPSNVDLDQVMLEMQAKYSPFDYVEDTYLYANFGHLNGYSAMYYTYMWSLVIASDLFSEFEQAGLRNKDVAERYRQTVLAPGGSKPAAQLVEDFLGRPYSFDAFARQLDHSR